MMPPPPAAKPGTAAPKLGGSLAFVLAEAWPAARQRPGLALILLAALAAQIVYRLSLPYYFQQIFDLVIIQGQADALLGAVLCIGGILILFTGAIVLQEWTAPTLALHMTGWLRERLFTKFLTMPTRQHARYSPAVLVERMGTNIGEIETALVRALPLLLLQGSIALTSVLFLFSIEWRLALVVVLSLPLTVVLAKPFSRRAAATGKQADTMRGEMLRLTQESAVGNAVLRLLGLHDAAISRFRRVLTALGAVTARDYLLSALSGRSAQVASGITQLLIIGFGGWLVFHGMMTGGLLVAFILLLSNVSAAAGYLGEALPGLSRGTRALSEIRGLLQLAGDVADPPDAVAIGTGNMPIRFEHVGFDHGETPVLRNIDFEVRPGEHMGVVGPSGSGKSTILALLCRLEEPKRGTIRLGGIPLSRITEASLRAVMTVVPQSSVLFSGTIRDNIMLGCPTASPAELDAALQAAALDQMVRDLPGGLDTEVGETGSQLSGGQRQRIAIARALLRQAPILVLDEATSALDPMAEHTVLQAIGALAGRRTVISVTHRLTSARSFDRILVVDQGRLVQCGPHARLIAEDGLYQRMWTKIGGPDQAPLAAGNPVTVDVLRGMDFFSFCTDSFLAEILPMFLPEQLPENREVFCQGDSGERFYVLARGTVEVLVSQPDGTQTSVGLLHDGDFFGETALLTQNPRNATIRTLTDCWFLTLHRQPFLSLLEKQPDIEKRITAAIAARMR